jgi:hypothetical protein
MKRLCIEFDIITPFFLVEIHNAGDYVLHSSQGLELLWLPHLSRDGRSKGLVFVQAFLSSPLISPTCAFPTTHKHFVDNTMAGHGNELVTPQSSFFIEVSVKGHTLAHIKSQRSQDPHIPVLC